LSGEVEKLANYLRSGNCQPQRPLLRD